jgi:hypothetical protein
MALKERTCRYCKALFVPEKLGARVCSVACAEGIAAKIRAKQERAAASEARKELRQARERVKTRAQWMKEAQAAFNAYVRARDAHRPCISCGRHHEGQYHAGHYLSVGARPELRFEELNVWKQCAPCNNHLSGNAVLYRKALVELIGVEKVDWLEGPHEPKKYSIEQLKAIKQKYTDKRKAMEAA